ncbi:MAG: flagellar motor switch protein FliN [Chromatiales bacterium]|nr:flagellar motor switch protein FliN [Chromatiales bacterium]
MSDDTEDQNGEEMTDDWADAFAEQEESEQGDADALIAEAEAATLPNLDDSGVAPASEDVNMDVILDIPVTIQMEIGRTKVNIRNLLQLNQGSVVELDRLAGEPLDVLVNNTLIAHGEVVVVNEKYGIRLTDVISPAERVKKLK